VDIDVANKDLINSTKLFLFVEKEFLNSGYPRLAKQRIKKTKKESFNLSKLKNGPT
jgi:hypothetical protein